MTTQTIINQLGGKMFALMTGATFMSNGENQLIVKFKGSKVANIMYITLDADDTYSVSFAKYRGMNIKTIKEVSGVYADMLRKLFTDTTALYTSL